MEHSITSAGFRLWRTEIDGVLLVEPHVFEDQRGYFFESYRQSALANAGVDATFVQDNQSMSAAGVVRGLHFQRERPQGKLLRVLSGAIFDVVVDIRRGSPTFGRWLGYELDACARRQIYMAPGMAHGYLALSDGTEICYKCTDYYDPSDEGGVHWRDPTLAIQWPLERVPEVKISDKDDRLASFAALKAMDAP